MNGDCTADCSYCSGDNCPYMKTTVPAHYKIARFVFVAAVIVAILASAMIYCVNNYKHQTNYQQVKK